VDDKLPKEGVVSATQANRFWIFGSHAMDETRNSIFATHMNHGMMAYANSLVIDHLQIEGVKFS